MGIRGPLPKTDEQRRLEGNPSKRPMRGKSPRPSGIPSCPDWLPHEAKQEWKRVAPELIRLGVITKLDRSALAGYCIAYSQWRQMQGVLQDQGMTYVTPRGQLKPRPEVEMARLSGEIMKTFAAELGMTPLSRERIRMPQPEHEPSAMELALREAERGMKR